MQCGALFTVEVCRDERWRASKRGESSPGQDRIGIALTFGMEGRQAAGGGGAAAVRRRPAKLRNSQRHSRLVMRPIQSSVQNGKVHGNYNTVS